MSAASEGDAPVCSLVTLRPPAGARAVGSLVSSSPVRRHAPPPCARLISRRDDRERKLATTGRAQFVRDTRKAYQDAMRDEFVPEIEALTGRSVIAFLSDNHIDPDVAVECFQLASRDGGD